MKGNESDLGFFSAEVPRSSGLNLDHLSPSFRKVFEEQFSGQRIERVFPKQILNHSEDLGHQILWDGILN